KDRHDRLVIEEATEGLSPVEEPMIRPVLAGGGAEANALARAGEPLRIDQSIQLGHLRRPQDVLDHEIALKIEEVLLELQVRSIHDPTLPRLRTIVAAPTTLGPASTLACLPARCPRMRAGNQAAPRG